MFYPTVLEWIQPVMVEKAWGQKLEASLSILGTDHISSTHRKPTERTGSGTSQSIKPQSPPLVMYFLQQDPTSSRLPGLHRQPHHLETSVQIPEPIEYISHSHQNGACF